MKAGFVTRAPGETVKTAPTAVRSNREASGPSSAFTMIELLVVIAIIGILVGIVVGAVQSVVRDRKIAQAKSEVQEIAMAAEEYYRLFQEIPVSTNWYDPYTTDSGADVWYVSGISSYGMAAEMYNRLLGSNRTETILLKIQRIEGVNSTNGVLRDPWGTPYDFYIDSTYDGQIALAPYRPAGWYNRIQQNCIMFIRSRGPDRAAGDLTPTSCDDITWPPLNNLRLIGW